MAGSPLRTTSQAAVPAPGDAIQVVTFFLAGEEYALAITAIREIIGPAEPTRLPHAPDPVIGLINLRGVVIPVFDPKRWFGLGAEAGPAPTTIIAEWQGEAFGLAVDSVRQVVWLPRDQIDPPSNRFEKRSPYIAGLGKVQGRLLILLDLAALFAEVEDAGAP